MKKRFLVSFVFVFSVLFISFFVNADTASNLNNNLDNINNFFLSFFISKRFILEPKSLGVFLVGSMIMEVSFTLPFILTAYGQEGLARIVLFDIGNTIMAFSFVYFIACRYGENKNSRILVKKIISSPPLLASLLAII